MRTARILEGETRWPFARQTRKGDGVLDRTTFYFGPGPEPVDWLIVFNHLSPEAELSFPKQRTLFISGEPPIAKQDPDFLAQFGYISSVDETLPHPKLLVLPPFLPWHVGVRTREPDSYGSAMSFAELEVAPPKTRLCSCIASALNDTPGHRLRYQFVRRLRRELGDRIDFFGRGVRSIADKDRGLAPYRYHVAIENAVVPHYWTEKLADPYLRNCFPIYFGAPNIHDYFDPESLAVIDIREPAAAIDKIARILESDLDRRSAAAVDRAKRRVLNDYNMLARLDHLLSDLELVGEPLEPPAPIYSQAHFAKSSSPLPWHLRLHENTINTLRSWRARLGLED